MSTPQDTFDALSSHLTERVVVEMLVKVARAELEYDDAKPDVGMEVLVSDVVEFAAEEIKAEAKLWGRSVYISASAIAQAEKIIRKMRY